MSGYYVRSWIAFGDTSYPEFAYTPFEREYANPTDDPDFPPDYWQPLTHDDLEF